MSFIRRDPFDQFRPKTAKLSDLYKSSTGSRVMPQSIKSAAKKVLDEAGYDRRQLRKIVDNDKDVRVDELKKVADELNDSRIFGFRKPGKITVDNYTKKEAVRQKSIRRLIAERQVEALNESVEERDRNNAIISRLKRRL